MIDLNNIDLIKSITKISLSEYHGDRFDYTIDNMDLVRKDFSSYPCYYYMGPYQTDGFYYIISINKDKIIINTNLIQSQWFLHKYGRKFQHSSDNELDYDMEFNLKTQYNKSLTSVLSGIRNNKLEMILL